MIRKATFQDRAKIIEILVSSFQDNLSIKYVLKRENGKKAIGALMSYSFDVCMKFGEVLITENREACALLLFSEKKKTIIKWDIKLALRAIGLNRIFKVLSRESKIKSKHPNRPYLYLWFIGVDPKKQKCGYGSILLNKVIEISDANGLDIFLETSTKSNIPWYLKNGFEIYDKLYFDYTLSLLRKKAVS
ncbi:MAG: GNAT family N-acetyltransferase [Fulvivirga sp.]